MNADYTLRLSANPRLNSCFPMTVVSSSVNDGIHNHNTFPHGKDNSVWKVAGVCPTHLSSTITKLVSKWILEKAIYRISDVTEKPDA